METHTEFARRVAARLAKARGIRAPARDSAQYMTQFEPKFRQFEELAARLVGEVIQPRMQIVAAAFPNSKLRRTERQFGCEGWFGYCERVPNSVRLELSVDSDEQLEQVILRRDLRIVPAFMKYDAHDKHVQPLGAFDQGQAAGWVEEQLLRFLDVYVSLDRGDDEADEPLATDPVCGMQVVSRGALQANHRGHTYYFCSQVCRERFEEAPERFVVLEME